MTYILETKDLCIQKGKKLLLDHVSIHVKEGTIYGLGGVNASGKSLLVKALCNSGVRFRGEVMINGRLDAFKHHNLIGIYLDDFGPLTAGSLYHNLVAKAKFMKVKDATDQAVALLQALDLECYAHEGLTQSASVLSLERMALSIIGKPPLIVLDDPFAHLSPTQKGLVKKVLEHCKKAGSSILMTSSRIEDFDGLADTYGLLVKGKLAVEMDSCDLKQKLSNKLHVRVDDVKRLCDLYPTAQVLDDGFVVIEDDGKVNKTLLDQGIKVYEIKRVKESKAHYFQNFLGGESHD